MMAVVLVAGGVLALCQTALQQSQETRSDASQGTTALTLTAVNGNVNLSWNSIGGASSYEI